MDDFDDFDDGIPVNPVLPAWFTTRMMTDTWSFGLLLVTGHLMAITRINEVRADDVGEIWLDVEMEQDPMWTGGGYGKAIGSPTSRTQASVNAAHVVAAFELADT